MNKRVVSQKIEAEKYSHSYSVDNISAMGVVGIVCFPLYYFVWHDLFPQPYESITLRFIGSALCLPLVFYADWPDKFKQVISVYLNICILYCLPFFFTFMLLKNDFSQVWNMSALVAIFILMILVTSLKGLVTLFVSGSFLAWAFFVLEHGAIVLPDAFGQYLAVASFAVFAGSVFNYRYYLSRLRYEKLQTLVAASGNIAHELRTPLLSIKSGIEGLSAYLPTLLQGYQQARKQGLDVPEIRKGHDEALAELAQRMNKEVDYANTVIDMLLVSSDQKNIQSRDFSPTSIKACIHKTLERYPFNSAQDKQRVQLAEGEDFIFIGSDILTIHVLFNLIKNALHAIAIAGKGEVTISLSESESSHHLHFRDTGTGIAEVNLPHVFERFYSTSKYGHGVGLSYCSMVMQSFGGNIECSSVEGEYTVFQLNFPKVKKENA